VLAVSGDGTERAAIARRAKDLGLAGRVFLLGKVGESELRALYAAADLFVLPTVAYEGFGMSTVEALAHGTPVLGTRVGATPEILSRFGDEFMVPEASAPALAAGIERLLPRLGPDLRDRVAELARAQYAWDVAIEPWERALLRVSRG
jgi:glycosyltransferase involved in cell wall biosynthesis